MTGVDERAKALREAKRVLAQIPGAGEMSDEAVARFEAAIRTIAADEVEQTLVGGGDVAPAEFSSRGFARLAEIVTSRNEHVSLSESSAASGPYVWLRVKVGPASPYVDTEGNEAHAHLSLEDLRVLRDQASYLLVNHYQVKAR